MLANERHYGIHESSTKSIWRVLHVKYWPRLFASNSIIFEHSSVYARVLALHIQCRLWCLRLKKKVVVAVRAIFIAVDGTLLNLCKWGASQLYLSSNSCVSLRKHLRHFLQAKVCRTSQQSIVSKALAHAGEHTISSFCSSG